RQATKTVPIVMVSIDDPAAPGLAREPANPETNLTGLTTFAPELNARRLDFLRQVVPKLTRAVVLWRSTSASGAGDPRTPAAAWPTARTGPTSSVRPRSSWTEF